MSQIVDYTVPLEVGSICGVGKVKFPAVVNTSQEKSEKLLGIIFDD